MKTSVLALLFPLVSLPVFAQGPLDPPAGPPGPSMKTLAQISAEISAATSVVTSTISAQGVQANRGTPITTTTGTYFISSPGTYFLTADRTAPTSGASISVQAQDVIVDLNGFTITGSGAASRGVSLSNSYTGHVVRNGTIRNCAGAVSGGSSGNAGIIIERVHALECTGFILDVLRNARISNCVVTGASGASVGISAWYNCVIENCHVTMPSGNGIQSSGNGVIVRGCTLTGTANNAIALGSGSQVEQCVVSGTTGAGISVSTNSRIINSQCVQNTGGASITTSTNCLVSGCEVSGNTSATNYYAFMLGAGSMVVDCTAANNLCTNATLTQASGGGFYISSNGTIRNCTASGNTGAGITVVGTGAVIEGNNVSGNGAGAGVGAGLWITGGNRVRIEGNHAVGNKTGFLIETVSGKNLVIRNTASNNTVNNWNVATGNYVAPVIAATAGVAFTGNSGGTALGSTDPFANFSLP